jgi:hypothetical protein
MVYFIFVTSRYLGGVASVVVFAAADCGVGTWWRRCSSSNPQLSQSRPPDSPCTKRARSLAVGSQIHFRLDRPLGEWSSESDLPLLATDISS